MTAASSESIWWIRESAGAPSLLESRGKAERSLEGSIAFAALIVFTCILLLNPQAWFPALKPLRIAFLTAGLAAASLLWERWRDRKPVGLTPEIVICFALLAWACMTVPLSYWPGGSVTTLTDAYIKAVIVFWLLANVIATERRLALFRIVLMLCSVPLAVMAVKNYSSASFISDADAVARITGYGQGLSANLNDLALMLNLLLPLSIARLLSATTTLVRVLCAAVIVISVIAVIVTFSRAGFLGLATICAVYFLRMIRRRGADRVWALAMFFAVLLAFPLVPANYVERVATITNVESDPTGSSQDRWRDTVAAAQSVGEHPILGAGIGMDIFALNQIRGEKWVQVHNVYLEYAVDLGVPGATLFLLLFYGVFKGVRSSRKRLAQLPAHRDLFLLVESLETSLIVFAISGFFYPIAYGLFFYFIGGLALAAAAITRKTLSLAPAER